MLALGALLFASAAAAQPAGATSAHVWPGDAAKQVTACGFQNVTLWYDSMLQEYAIVVSGPQSGSDDRLSCAARASLGSGYPIQFQAPLNLRYDQLYWPMAEETARGQARAWLAHRGLLSKLPPYSKGRTDQLAYARQLERVCGPRARGAFTMEEGLVTMRLRSADRPALDPATFDCLANALWASGLPMGFGGSDRASGN
jgi:hypothetical protein